MPTTPTLKGTVIDQATEQTLGGLEGQISADQQTLTSPLATATTDAAGQFVVQLDIASQGLAEAVVFKVLQSGRLLELTDKEITSGGRDPNPGAVRCNGFARSI